MGSDLQPRNFGGGSGGAELSRRRSSRQLAAIQNGNTLDLARLAAEGNHAEVRAMLRKRITEDGMHDVTEVAQVAQQLANGDPFIGAMIIPIVQEFARQTVNDIRHFGR